MNWVDYTPPQGVSISLIATSVIMLSIAIAMWTQIGVAWIKRISSLYRVRWPITHRSSVAADPLILYVGEITVSDDYLRDNLFIEIAVRSFNATPQSVIVTGAHGHVKCVGERLPPPNLLMERGPPKGIVQAHTEFLVVIEQRMPRELADRLCNLASTDRVQLGLDGLDILLAPQTTPSRYTRLPVYDVSLHRDITHLRSIKIIKGSAVIKAG
jgi:hypothetical protein